MPTIDDLLEKAKARAGARPLPESTYRMQFHAGFTFRDAERIVGYLHDLGVTHCYASPYLRARPGSTHGYDIIDHGALNPEVGGAGDYDAFVRALRARGMGQLLDTVPNHMGVATDDNAWWNDVLENGPASRYAGHFDVAWRASPRPQMQDKVLLPVLGGPYGEVLEKGELRLTFEAEVGAFAVRYFDRRFPVAPRTYGTALGHRLEELEQVLGAEAPAFAEYQSILTALRNLPDRSETDPARLAERQREKEVIKRRLAALAADSPPARAFVDDNVARFNADVNLLDDLLDHQCYRLSYWRVAADEINYRRFFDINDLAALSMEREEVFEGAHALILRLLAEGQLDGLRVDHPDGLYDPAQYFRRLQEHYLLACARAAFDADPRGAEWKELEGPLRERVRAVEPGPPRRWPLYVVAEKILAAGEPLPEGWAVYGTSGYDFLNVVNGLFVDPAGEKGLTALYAEWARDGASFAELAYRGKTLILRASLSSELHTLAHQLDRLAQKDRRSRDFTLHGLRVALREVIACFPVYRSYIAGGEVHPADKKYVEQAVRQATRRNPVLSRSIFRFIRDMLLLKYPASSSEEDRDEQRRFAGKFQQVTSPVTAKGVEDTAFYVYHRLVSLNEVGGDPGRFGVAPAALHADFGDRQARWPYALSPLSTHDTKRSEDVRARLNVLSELPDQWRECVARWGVLNAGHKPVVDDRPVPDGNDEYLLYQTLVGAWPLGAPSAEEHAAFVGRIQAYMEKALHEAKVHTSWVNPDAEYDEGVKTFVARVLDEGASGDFLRDLRAFVRRVSHYGLFNALAQTLLRLTAPGVPDTYQGTELWDFSLVDPDNRRPVDYERRAQLLAGLRADGQDSRALARGLVEAKEDGRVKLYVTSRALHCRREHPGLFSAGQYLPLETSGEKADHLFAFARRAGDAWAVVAVPRLVARLAPGEGQAPLGREVWGDTRLALPEAGPGVRWRNVFTGASLVGGGGQGGASLAAADVFADFPVALLLGGAKG